MGLKGARRPIIYILYCDHAAAPVEKLGVDHRDLVDDQAAHRAPEVSGRLAAHVAESLRRAVRHARTRPGCNGTGGSDESDALGPRPSALRATAARPGLRQDGAFGLRHAAALAVQRLPLRDQGGDARRRRHEDPADAVLLLEGADDLAQCEGLARAWLG